MLSEVLGGKEVQWQQYPGQSVPSEEAFWGEQKKQGREYSLDCPFAFTIPQAWAAAGRLVEDPVWEIARDICLGRRAYNVEVLEVLNAKQLTDDSGEHTEWNDYGNVRCNASTDGPYLTMVYKMDTRWAGYYDLLESAFSAVPSAVEIEEKTLPRQGFFQHLIRSARDENEAIDIQGRMQVDVSKCSDVKYSAEVNKRKVEVVIKPEGAGDARHCVKYDFTVYSYKKIFNAQAISKDGSILGCMDILRGTDFLSEKIYIEYCYRPDITLSKFYQLIDADLQNCVWDNASMVQRIAFKILYFFATCCPFMNGNKAIGEVLARAVLLKANLPYQSLPKDWDMLAVVSASVEDFTSFLQQEIAKDQPLLTRIPPPYNPMLFQGGYAAGVESSCSLEGLGVKSAPRC